MISFGQKWAKQSSIRMKENNPMKRTDVQEKSRKSHLGKKRPDVSEKLKGRKRPEHSEWMKGKKFRLGKKDLKCSKRMKENNPMNRPEIVAKMKKSAKENWLDSDYKLSRSGENHPMF